MAKSDVLTKQTVLKLKMHEGKVVILAQFQLKEWFTKVGSSVRELDLDSSFSVYGFDSASSIFSGCTMTTTRLEDISSIAYGSIVNVVGIVS